MIQVMELKTVVKSKTVDNHTELGLPDSLAIPLHTALTYRRGNETASEAEFVAWLVTYCTQYAKLTKVDEAGNLHFEIPKADGTRSKTIFAAHTDTVTSKVGRGSYCLTGSNLTVGEDEDCLGADDGAGVAILCHMMYHKVPGTYLWCRAEEVGGLGASYIAKTLKLSSYQRSICFDRAGTSEIITVQGGERLASSEFAEALWQQLAEQDLLYSESTHGVFTDNALWGDIPCNVNLSVGYFKQHSRREHLDLLHFAALATAVLGVDWENLPVARDPKVVEMKDYQNLYHYPNANKGYNSAPREPLLHEEYDRFFTDPNYEGEEESEWTEIDKELALMDEANFNFLYDSYDSFIDEFGDGEVVPDFRAWYADVFRMS